MSARVDTTHSRINNNMLLKQSHPENRSAPTCSTLSKITCIALAITAYLGQGFITQRPTCVQWSKDMREAKQWAVKQKGWYETTLITYKYRAKLNCDWERCDWELSAPSTSRNPEMVEFCDTRSMPTYPIEKIPSLWKTQVLASNHDYCEKRHYAGLELTCFAQDVTKAHAVYKRHEKQLDETLSDKPLLCSRVSPN